MRRLSNFLFGKSMRMIVLVLCCAPIVVAQADSDIQSRVNSLTPGESSLEQIKSLFGEPEAQRNLYEWWSGWRDGKFEGLYTPATLEKEKVGLERVTKRTLYDLQYPKQGLVITVFDNPWQLHSITIETTKVSVLGIRVGDPLKKVVVNLGKGEWSTSDRDDYWWLTYEERGVRFGFLRNSKAPKYPMRLARRRVVSKIEKFDNKVSFT